MPALAELPAGEAPHVVLKGVHSGAGAAIWHCSRALEIPTPLLPVLLLLHPHL